VGIAKFMLTMGVLAILTEFTVTTGLFKKFAFYCFVVTIRKLVIKLLLQAYFGNIMIRKWLVF
jgi:hypothetical protein